MAKKPAQAVVDDSATTESVNMAKFLAKRPDYKHFEIWLVGDTPLIVHAWSEKARREMLGKQVQAPQPGKAARDPKGDFRSSLYDLGDGTYGFPAMGIKNAILSVSHKDKGVPRSTIMGALFIQAPIMRTRAAMAGAICDMPLLKIFGSPPEMREDMVKIGAGLNKTANLAYRGQFTTWAMKLCGKFNSTVLNEEMLSFLVMEAGIACGLGEWRNERKGVFGAFHMANAKETQAWEAFSLNKGPLPANGLAMAAE